MCEGQEGPLQPKQKQRRMLQLRRCKQTYRRTLHRPRVQRFPISPRPRAPQPRRPLPTKRVAAERDSAVPTGGLVVYENGKVIYRTPSQNSSQSAKDTQRPPSMVPSKVADEYLMLRVEPDYPESAREQHIQGPVVLEALVGKDGAVEKLSTVSGDSQLATAATNAVRQWRFKPFLRKARQKNSRLELPWISDCPESRASKAAHRGCVIDSEEKYGL